MLKSKPKKYNVNNIIPLVNNIKGFNRLGKAKDSDDDHKIPQPNAINI